MSIRLKLTLLLSFLFISAVGNALFTFQLEKNGEEKLEWVTHTNKVIIDINEFLSHLKDTETGQRGYLLTGDISYLAPYHDGIIESKKHFGHLKELTSDNPLQQKRLDSVKKLMTLKFDELAQTIKLKQNKNANEALAIVNKNKGKQYMDDIRIIFDEFLQTEVLLLKQRKKDFNENRADITFTIIIEIILFVFLAFITVLFLNKNLFSPLKILLSNTQKMEVGEKIDIVNIASNDEIGDLHSSFFKMYEEVRARTKLLRKTNSQFKEAQKLTHLGNWEWDIKNNTLSWSDEIYRIFGLKPQEFTATYKTFINTVHIDDRALIEESVNKAMETGEDYSLSYRIVLPDGSKKIVYEHGQVELDENKEPIRMMGTVQDITESKKTIEEITILSKAIEEIDDIIMIDDRAGVITFVNDAYVKHTGFSREETIGKMSSILKSGEHDKDFYKKMWKEITTGNVYRGLMTNKKKDGEFYYEEKTISPIHDDNGVITSFVSTGKDITERIEMQHALEKEVRHDGLTGLYNRRYYDEVVAKELSRAKRAKQDFNFVMMDIDYFKPYNDTYGHQEGDNTLKAVAKLLKEKFTRGSDYCFRLGGEEFGFFIIGNTLEESLKYTQEICNDIEKLHIKHSKNKASDYVTASFGLINIDSSVVDEHAMYVAADKALYRAKESGRNRVCVHDTSEIQIF